MVPLHTPGDREMGLVCSGERTPDRQTSRSSGQGPDPKVDLTLHLPFFLKEIRPRSLSSCERVKGIGHLPSRL